MRGKTTKFSSFELGLRSRATRSNWDWEAVYLVSEFLFDAV
jgi:hypothetical protein